MRIPRSIQLHHESGLVHIFWRCHNKEFYLNSRNEKERYLSAVKQSIQRKCTYNNKVKIESYCVMANHFHQLTRYDEDSKNLSDYMRHCHGLYGADYNRAHKRSGKVAEGRPKTALVENIDHAVRVHFYIEANPIRAGLCTAENLKNYPCNSFKFYAYGIKDEFTEILDVPEWYMRLGKSAQQRQEKYRRLFYEYLGNQNLIKTAPLYLMRFIGGPFWVREQRDYCQRLMERKLTFKG